ncbi:MAG: beta-propeller fold lactonase family protein [Candidatus Cybelea sp.]
MRLSLMLTSTIALLAACSGGGAAPPNPLSSAGVRPAPVPNVRSADRVRAVTLYTLSNGAAHNQVVSFVPRDGRLEYDQSFDTGGLGEPSIAGTVQGSIAHSDDGRFLFAVDAGSNEITSFRIDRNGLQFVDKVASRGMEPVSLAVHGDLLFVLNEASSSISGFRITRNGALRSIQKSSAPLSGTNVGPAEISFDPGGKVLVVTEKATNDIDTYSVAKGIPTGPTVHSSSGMTPFGFAFVPGNEIMVVSEAFGGTSGAGAASSYMVAPPSTLTPISMSVPDHNTAPCWVVITRNGSFAFTSNTASATISAYAIDEMGNLTLTTPNGVSAQTGQSPTDLALGPRDTYLFVLNLKSRTIGAYAIGSGGALTTVRGAHGLPPHAMGLAAVSTEF